MGIFDKIVEGVDRQTWVNPLSDLMEKAQKSPAAKPPRSEVIGM